jgi:hypothetical protein
MAVVRSTLVLVWLGLAACGGGDDVDCKSVMTAGMPPASSLVASLSMDQRVQLCDLAACQNGGCNVQRSCPNGPAVTFAPNREKCLSDTPTNPECRATVGDLLACLAAVRANSCVSTFLGSPACQPVTQFECLTFRPQAAATGMIAFDSRPDALQQ